MLWMMAIISFYAVAFFIFHSPTYGIVHLACWQICKHPKVNALCK